MGGWVRADSGRNIRIYEVGVALATLLRHDPDRQARYLMDTAGWVSASTIPQTKIMRKFGHLSDEDLRILIEMENWP
eukprot:15484805-Alexandrium_andersonii.AAC.1